MNARQMKTKYRMAEWTALLQERAASGESIVAFCQERGIKKHQYFYWQRKLRETACEQLATTASGFAAVNLPVAPLETSGQVRIEVSGATISADSTYPPDKLAALLRELRQC